MTMEEVKANTKKAKILAVDLDGSLLLYDSLLYMFIKSLARPHIMLKSLFLLTKSKAKFKNYLAENIDLNFNEESFNAAVVKYIRDKSSGKELDIYLATGANVIVAQKIWKIFPEFKGIIASNEYSNCIGKNKLTEILKISDQFDYIGNSFDDLILWEKSASIICVKPNSSLKKKVLQLNKPTTIIL